MRFSLGEFERAVLLAVARLDEQAYGMRIRQELELRLDRSVSIGAVYTTLDRMQEKGYVSSRLGEPTSIRGGRAKKFFRVEALGTAALNQSREVAKVLWAMLPQKAR
jgi:DNA-binding PadR family transcriptional regulator